MTNLAPGEEVFVSTFREEAFDNSTIQVEINYEDILGESGRIAFRKEPKLPEFLVAGGIRRMPGILLNFLRRLKPYFQSLEDEKDDKKS